MTRGIHISSDIISENIITFVHAIRILHYQWRKIGKDWQNLRPPYSDQIFLIQNNSEIICHCHVVVICLENLSNSKKCIWVLFFLKELLEIRKISQILNHTNENFIEYKLPVDDFKHFILNFKILSLINNIHNK